ncbi:Unknown protein sequence [Pseudomonas savastanoi pv. phaseolicola]|nr:Unknown protein sequence [Pseudomonas savastanoi pv. phaseolicola]KPB45027.1 Unknown protein sequence [Pseudomonas savastanoi pv. phaseolicola]KPB62726.1 Unknown protein sequence [Pseudomonas savastanoi pv. phaseolicola]KPB72794.1 Unknown protein sequence [Pseudomonas amygdali pv. mellea]
MPDGIQGHRIKFARVRQQVRHAEVFQCLVVVFEWSFPTVFY